MATKYDHEDAHRACAGPVYCSVPGCRTHVGGGRYVRSVADLQFTTHHGQRITLCGRHYLDGLDTCGHSVMAQLRRDADSLVAHFEAAHPAAFSWHPRTPEVKHAT
ncbi:hypothetical protein [Dyella japonica]|uniref:Uncharacterized protein n=1 Tax=Dyella japonica TaxID=231455 RepID=A0ABV2K3S1_9GAMM